VARRWWPSANHWPTDLLHDPGIISPRTAHHHVRRHVIEYAPGP
jgi:hypothetical protein